MNHSTGKPTALNAVIATIQSAIVDMNGYQSVSVQVNYSDVAPAAKTVAATAILAANITANTLPIAAHGYITGTKVALTTTTTLPGGTSATDYWIIKVSAGVVSLATSLANAVAGTAVDITDAGVGTHTLTPVASGSNVFKLQKSLDQSNWIDVSSATVTIATSTSSTMFEVASPSYRYLKLLYTPSAGQVNLETFVNLVS
jgi:hypothetical protein